MKFGLTAFAIATLLFPVAASAAAADVIAEPNWGPVEEIESYTVGPGIKYTKYYYPKKPLLIWFTEVDLTNPYNKIEQVQSRKQVPDVLRWDLPTFYKECSSPGHQVKVAWNHDFFSYDMGICIGINISDGEFTWRRDFARSLLAFTKDGKAEIFAHSAVETKITADNGLSLDISCYNSDAITPLTGNCILFNRMNSRTLVDEGKYIALKPLGEWSVNGAPIPCKVLEVSDSPIQTADGRYVLYLRNDAITTFNASPLTAGDEVKVVQRFTAAKWGNIPENIVNAFHGYPSLVHDGVFHDGEYNDFENGREYETSSHVLAGLSQDKTKLYVALNEMSTQSSAVNCVDLCSWMVNRGSWDIVNFDSGGSAAIAIDGEMLNLPGRGSVRPVEDAMLAVSLAPESSTTARIAFSKSAINTSVIAITPLRVMAFNEYDEVLDKDLKGCSFSCEPESLGYVDNDGIFHPGTEGITGKIIAEKDGLKAEIPVTTIGVNDVSPRYASITIDRNHSPLIEIDGKTETETFALSPLAFEWTVANPEVCHITDGILYADSNGATTIVGRFADVAISIDVAVEMSDTPWIIENFVNPETYTTSTSGVANVAFNSSPLPEGWSDGTVINFDITGSRISNLDINLKKKMFGLPESVSLEISDPEATIKNSYFIYEDAQGNKVTRTLDFSQGSVINTRLGAKDEPLPYYAYPLTLNMLRLSFDPSKRGTGKSIAVRDFKAVYATESGVETISAANPQETIAVCVEGETVIANYNSDTDCDAFVSMYSATGALVASKKIKIAQGDNQIAIDAKFASTGFYFVTLSLPGKRITGKTIIK